MAVSNLKPCPVCKVKHKFKESAHYCIQGLWVKFYGSAPKDRKPMTEEEKTLMSSMENFYNSLPNQK